MSPWINHVIPVITLPVLRKSLADSALMAGEKLSLEELDDPLWQQESCKAASCNGRWRVCDGIRLSASPLSYLHVWQKGSSHPSCWNESQPGNDPCIQRISGPRRNCCFNLNVLGACQMTRPRRNEVRPAVAELCHDFAMSPSWLIRTHENSQTFPISFSEAWLSFALQSEPNDQWTPAGDSSLAAGAKEPQGRSTSPYLSCVVGFDGVFGLC